MKKLLAANPFAISVLESITDAFFAIDADETIAYVNKPALIFFNKKAKELIGKNVWQELSFKEIEEFKSQYKLAQKGNKSITYEMYEELLNKWFMFILAPRKEGVTVYVHDITEKKEKEEQDRFLGNIFSNVSDAIIATDLDYTIVSFNKAAEKMYGWKAKEVIGKKANEVIKTMGANGERPDWLPQIKKNGSWRGEVIQYGKVNKLNILASVSVMKDEDGEITGYVAVNKDITERKQVEETLRRFHFMSDNANVSLFFTDRKGNFLYANKNTYERLGYSKKEFFNKKSYELDIYYDKAEFQKLFDLIQRKPVPPFETLLRKKDGTTLDVEVSYSGVTFENEDYMFCVSHDITNRKRTERVLNETEERFRIMADTAPVLIWMRGPDKKCFFLNKGWLTFTGKRMDQESGTGWTKGIHPEDYDRMMSVYKTAFDKREPFTVEYRLLRNDGKYRWVIENGRPRFSEDGVFLGYIGTDIDITERKDTEAKLGSFMDSNIIGIVFSDLNTGKIDQANDAFLEMLGYTHKDFANGLVNRDSINLEKYENLDIDAIRAAEKFGRCQPYEKEYKRKDGTKVPVLVGFSFIGKDKKNTVAFILDLTRMKEVERRKDEFIGLASHELKTPVTTIKAFAQMLERYFHELKDQKAITYLVKMNSQLNRLTNLIEELLDVSRIQAGKLSLYKKNISLQSVVQQTIEEIQTISPNHKISLTGSTKRHIFADEYRLSQVMINLLTNAVKYSPKANKVEVFIEEKDDELIVSVKDSGIGIAKNKQDKIFERFYRVNTLSSKTFSGLGLGLNIAWEIVTRHDGNMWVSSKLGKGTTFYFSLPIQTNGK